MRDIENKPDTFFCRYLVSGRVQGVFYRASTARKARELNITGHARNLADGRVEVLACGERSAVIALGEWLWQGPSGARVSDVRGEELQLGEGQIPQRFVTR